MVAIGDKVRYTGTNDKMDLTPGKVYTVTSMGRNSGFSVIDDIRENNFTISWDGNYEVVRVEDYRTSNPRLHSQYVDNAKRVLSVIETALRELDEMSLVDASLVAGTLRKERAALVVNNAAYMDAAAILYVGEDWLKEAE